MLLIQITMISISISPFYKRYNKLSVIDFVKPKASITPSNFFFYCFSNCFNSYRLLFNFQNLLLILLGANFLILSGIFIKISFLRLLLKNAATISIWCNLKSWKTTIARIIYSIMNFRIEIKVLLKSSSGTCEKSLTMI